MAETKKYLIFLLLAVFLSIFIFFGQAQTAGQVGGAYVQAQALPGFPQVPDRSVGRPPVEVAQPSELTLSARAVLVKDRNSGVVLYEANSQEAVPVASLTKLMTAIVVHQRASLDDIVEITPQDTKTPEYRIELLPGEKIRVQALLEAMLVSSANDAAEALAQFVGGTTNLFVQEMNDEAKALGMNNTNFTNPVGFDDPNHYASAADLSILVGEFMRYPDLLEMVRLKSATVASVNGQYQHQLGTTNKLMLAHEDVVGLKTGYTSEAKGNLILLVNTSDDIGPSSDGYYSIILGSSNREAESEKVMSWVKENYKWN